MQKLFYKKIFIKVLCLAILSFALFEIGNQAVDASPRECPNEVYDNCWQPGTFYSVDPSTCTCFCPTYNADCPNGQLVDQSTCTCAASNPELGGCPPDKAFEMNMCLQTGGRWDTQYCYCTIVK